jgi:uncharacterized membrane protein YedE/YeeE
MNTRVLSAVTVVVSGALFGFGLALSTMIKPEVVLNFLRFTDFGLLLVLGGALAVALLAYQSAPRLLKRALLNEAFAQRPTAALKNTLIGSALFGVGWGICGVCPGPAIAGLGAGNWPLAITVVAMLLGAYVQGRFARVN